MSRPNNRFKYMTSKSTKYGPTEKKRNETDDLLSPAATWVLLSKNVKTWANLSNQAKKFRSQHKSNQFTNRKRKIGKIAVILFGLLVLNKPKKRTVRDGAQTETWKKTKPQNQTDTPNRRAYPTFLSSKPGTTAHLVCFLSQTKLTKIMFSLCSW